MGDFQRIAGCTKNGNLIQIGINAQGYEVNIKYQNGKFVKFAYVNSNEAMRKYKELTQ